MPPDHPNRRAVVVMAKAPRPGRVKTRLAPMLGNDGCARLQAQLLAGTAALAARAGAVWVAVDPADAGDEVAPLVPAGTVVIGQTPGADLGRRIADATAAAFAAGHAPVVVLGTDVPLLTEGHLNAAFDALDRAAVVFGPALDGGYYLLGMGRHLPGAVGIDPAAWGGPTVLADSLAVCAAAGLATATLDPLPDLDTPEDAAGLLARPDLPAGLREALGG